MKIILLIILLILLVLLILISFLRYKNEASITSLLVFIGLDILVCLMVLFFPLNNNPLKKEANYSKINIQKIKPIDINKEEPFVNMSSNLKFYKEEITNDVDRFTAEREGFRITEDLYKDKVLKTSCTVAVAGKEEFIQNLEYLNRYLTNIFGLNTNVGKWFDKNIEKFQNNKQEFTKTKIFEDKNVKFQIVKDNDMYIIFVDIIHK